MAFLLTILAALTPIRPMVVVIERELPSDQLGYCQYVPEGVIIITNDLLDTADKRLVVTSLRDICWMPDSSDYPWEEYSI